MMEISRASQPFPAGPESVSIGLVGYHHIPENTHLPGYNLNNEPFPVRETFAHNPDPVAYDYYPNLNAAHEYRQEEARRDFNANYLSSFDRTPEPICIDPPMAIANWEPIRLPIAEPVAIVDMNDFRQPRDLSSFVSPTFVFETASRPDFPELPLIRQERQLLPDLPQENNLISSNSVSFFEKPTNLPTPAFLEAPLFPIIPDVHLRGIDTAPMPIIRETVIQDTPLLPLAPPPLMDLTPKFKLDASLMPIVGDISLAPIVSQRDSEIVYGGYGNSHFSHIEDIGWHATTQIPGLGKKEGFDTDLTIDPLTQKRYGFKGFSIHDPI